MAKRSVIVEQLTFSGHTGRRRLLEGVKAQALVSANHDIASILIKRGCLAKYKPGDILMRQGESQNDLFLIITGEVVIKVNDREVATRAAGTHVGEMALVDQLATRSATVVAKEYTTAMVIAEHRFTPIARKYPELWRRIAVEIARRLRERNRALRQPHDKPVLFIGSSTEGQAITNELYNRLNKKPVVPRRWTEGVFQASRTSIENLVRATQDADFAALVLTADDVTISRGRRKASPRDNVIFELGLFMGALGRERTFILKPCGTDVRIPTDLLGVTRVEYSTSGSMYKRVNPACKQMLKSIMEIGPR